MMKPLLHPLALAVGLLSLTAYADDTQTASQNFSKVVIFGDSLSDTGRAKELVDRDLPALGNLLQPSFTTNPDPVWATIFANYYGKTAIAMTDDTPDGTNYAVGGSQSGNIARWGGTPVQIPTTATQIGEYLTKHNQKADPNALYAVWIGANDLFYNLEQGTPENIATSISATVNDINTLNNAGAKFILVPNIPDLSLTPLVQIHPVLTTKKPEVKLFTQVYNRGVFRALNQVNANIIPANTFALLQEAVDNKEAFGLSEVVETACAETAPIPHTSSSLACDESKLVAPNAGETHMFADLIHPSGRTHRILAQYYRSLIDSPSQMGQLTAQVAKHDTHRLYQKLATLDSHTHSVWADIGKDNGKTSTLIGLDMAGQNRHTGAYVAHKTSDHKTGTVHADAKETGVGLYHQHDVGQLRLTADVGIDKLSLDTDRQVAWDGMARSHQASTAGTRYFAGGQVSYGMHVGKVMLRPSVGVHAQTVTFDDVIENQSQLSTALQYSLPKYKSLQGVLGLGVNYTLSDRTHLHASLAHRQEFKDNTGVVHSKLSSMPEYSKSYALPVSLKKTHSQKADVGAVVKVGNANIGAGLTATHTDGDSDVGGYAGVQMKF